jgi:hypothetical protein
MIIQVKQRLKAKMKEIEDNQQRKKGGEGKKAKVTLEKRNSEKIYFNNQRDKAQQDYYTHTVPDFSSYYDPASNKYLKNPKPPQPSMSQSSGHTHEGLYLATEVYHKTQSVKKKPSGPSSSFSDEVPYS